MAASLEIVKNKIFGVMEAVNESVFLSIVSSGLRKPAVPTGDEQGMWERLLFYCL